jgi:hypothetical protein
MKSSSFAKAITLGCLVFIALPVACGDDTTTPTKPKGGAGAGAGGEYVEEAGTGGGGVVGGAGGAAPAPALMIPGTSDMSQTIKCGTDMCTSIKALSTTPLYVNPCCAGDAKDACGLSTEFFAVLGTAFSETCQAQGQEGPVDTACPNSPDQMLPFNGMTYHVPGFVGCCRAETGTCGVVIDKVAVTELGGLPFASPMLGCADAAPFLGTAAGKLCGAGGGNSGGASGAGGASPGGTSGAGGAGGAP